MFHHLRGRLAAARPSEVVIDCAGVGFRLRIPLSTYEVLPPEGSECELLAFLCVRENEILLYGFTTEAERTCFERLLSVAGVGPASALSLLSSSSVSEIVRAARKGEFSALTRAKGIGRRTAERITLELKRHVSALLRVLGEAGEERPEALHEATLALVNLGYSEAEAASAAAGAVRELGKDAPLERILRKALRGRSGRI